MKLIATIDPGHGWLRVPVKLLEQLNIVDKISHYSYKCAGYAFLEEDCDWGVFVQAMEKIGNEEVRVRASYSNPEPPFEKTVFIENVGIYDENRNLIAVAKMATPIRKRSSDDLTFKLKLDF